MIVVSFCLLLASNAIVGATPYYQSEIETINARRNDMYRLEEETKLFEFGKNDDGSVNYDSIVNQNDVFQKYALSHILYSYDLHRDEWNAKYTKESDNPYSIQEKYGVESASFSNDYLGYFYVNYAKDNNENNNLFALENGESYISHFKSVLLNHSKGAEWSYFEDSDKLPCLWASYAHTLYRYLFFDEGGQSGLTTYNFLMSQYQGVFEEASNILFHSNRYQTMYSEYKEAYGNCSRIISLFSFVSYLVTFLLCYLLPILLFKNGQTVGLFLWKGAIIHHEGLDVSKGQLLLRALVSFFSFFPIMLFSCYFAGGLNSGWMYPLFSIGDKGISFFNITVMLFVVPIANFFTMLINKERRSLTELASGTMVIDTKYYVEHNIKEENHEEEQNEPEPVVTESPYFDSSNFDNTERKKEN